MALTASTFKQRWPEFEATSDARVTTALAVATTQVNAAIFTGDRFDHAVGLLAAHGLSVSPFGRPAKAKESGRSAYLEEFERLARARCAGPWLASQRYDGTVPSTTTSDEE